MSGLSKYQKFIMEAAFKNAVKQKPNTNSNLAWYEEEGSISRRISMSSLWVDSDYIPLEAPTNLIQNKYVVTLGTVRTEVLEKINNLELSKVLGTPASFYNELLIDAIDPSYGKGYDIILRDIKGEIIPFGLNQWVVDGESGILSFIGGLPDGYDAPFTVSFYRYIGRKGSNGLVTTDGSVPMMPGYTPTEPLQIATKKYVDQNLTATDETIKKLIPRTPDTFEGKDLEIIRDKDIRGSLLTTTDPEVQVVYDNNHEEIKIRVPTFYKPDDSFGKVSVLVNDNEVYKCSINDLKEGLVGTFTVDSIINSYEDQIVGYAYYKSVNMHITLDILASLVPYVLSSKTPYVKIKMKYSEGIVEFCSNELIVGLDNISPNATIKNSYFTNLKGPKAYISGVPAVVAGNVLSYQTNILTLKKYKKLTMGHLTIGELYDQEILTEDYYGSFNPNTVETVDITIHEDYYSETLPTLIKSYNLEGENGSLNLEYLIRVDSKSDESNRVDSETLDIWDSTASIVYKNELQMLGGQYQWPRGDYSFNGNKLYIDLVPAGPDYSDIDGTERFVTLKYNIENKNGFYLEIPSSEGLSFDPDTKAILSFSTFACKVGKDSDWLDMNTPYDGVGSPLELENKGCLVVDDSSYTKHYYTFGDKTLSGDLFIKVGIPNNKEVKFSNLKVSFRDSDK